MPSLANRVALERLGHVVLETIERIFAARASWILTVRAAPDAPDALEALACRGAAANYYRGYSEPADRGPGGLALSTGRPVFVADVSRDTRWTSPARMHGSGIRSAMLLPLKHDDRPLGVVGFDSPRFSPRQPPSPSDYDLFRAFSALTALALVGVSRPIGCRGVGSTSSNTHADHEPAGVPSGPFGAPPPPGGASAMVIGPSAALGAVLAQMQMVAPADSSVLLLGETGTGKELIARAIHDASGRAAQPFIAFNCAALPESLVESELFGYEKGAFTGAAARRAGRFELAHRGTLFLDEVGDMPVQSQVKLLRALQEREIMRLGSTRPVPVDVRVVAATNQDLDSAVSAGRFRSDLFYRLNVFPIAIPPLRERREDIGPLAAHFIQSFGERLHKRVVGLTPSALERLVAHDWPGNVRELQNVIERAIILTSGSMLGGDMFELRGQPTAPAGMDGRSNADATGATAPGSGVTPPADAQVAAAPASEGMPAGPVESFRDAEKAAILRALDSTAWRISGRNGAADLLELKPTTLHAKMKRLQIRRRSPGLVSRAAAG